MLRVRAFTRSSKRAVGVRGAALHTERAARLNKLYKPHLCLPVASLQLFSIFAQLPSASPHFVLLSCRRYSCDIDYVACGRAGKQQFSLPKSRGHFTLMTRTATTVAMTGKRNEHRTELKRIGRNCIWDLETNVET